MMKGVQIIDYFYLPDPSGEKSRFNNHKYMEARQNLLYILAASLYVNVLFFGLIITIILTRGDTKSDLDSPCTFNLNLVFDRHESSSALKFFKENLPGISISVVDKNKVPFNLLPNTFILFLWISTTEKVEGEYDRGYYTQLWKNSGNFILGD